MDRSESIGKLALALSKLQGEVTDAAKDKKGYGYNYADLAGVLEIARPLLLKNELSISQLCTTSSEGLSHIGVETILMHSSGEYIANTMYMPVEPKKGLSAAQCAGVVITYCRRYALAAILGITQTDNDTSPVTVDVDDPQDKLRQYCKSIDVTKEQANEWCAMYGVTRLSQLNKMQIDAIIGDKFNG